MEFLRFRKHMDELALEAQGGVYGEKEILNENISPFFD
jgi:hypothetical protein